MTLAQSFIGQAIFTFITMVGVGKFFLPIKLSFLNYISVLVYPFSLSDTFLVDSSNYTLQLKRQLQTAQDNYKLVVFVSRDSNAPAQLSMAPNLNESFLFVNVKVNLTADIYNISFTDYSKFMGNML